MTTSDPTGGSSAADPSGTAADPYGTAGAVPQPSNPAPPASSTSASDATAAASATVDDSNSFSKDEFLATLKKWAIILVVGFIAIMFAAYLLPRGWANFVGGFVDNRFSVGSFGGVVIGFFSILLPMVLLTFAVRNRDSRGLALTLLALAFVTAIPNLATLWVVVGGGSGPTQGRSIMNEQAPGFRGGSLLGAIGGAALGGYLLWGMFQRDRQAKKLAEANEAAANTKSSRRNRGSAEPS